MKATELKAKTIRLKYDGTEQSIFDELRNKKYSFVRKYNIDPDLLYVSPRSFNEIMMNSTEVMYEVQNNYPPKVMGVSLEVSKHIGDNEVIAMSHPDIIKEDLSMRAKDMFQAKMFATIRGV